MLRVTWRSVGHLPSPVVVRVHVPAVGEYRDDPRGDEHRHAPPHFRHFFYVFGFVFYFKFCSAARLRTKKRPRFVVDPSGGTFFLGRGLRGRGEPFPLFHFSFF
jgi:hypothetical protein